MKETRDALLDAMAPNRVLPYSRALALTIQGLGAMAGCRERINEPIEFRGRYVVSSNLNEVGAVSWAPWAFFLPLVSQTLINPEIFVRLRPLAFYVMQMNPNPIMHDFEGRFATPLSLFLHDLDHSAQMLKQDMLIWILMPDSLGGMIASRSGESTVPPKDREWSWSHTIRETIRPDFPSVANDRFDRWQQFLLRYNQRALQVTDSPRSWFFVLHEDPAALLFLPSTSVCGNDASVPTEFQSWVHALLAGNGTTSRAPSFVLVNENEPQTKGHLLKLGQPNNIWFSDLKLPADDPQGFIDINELLGFSSPLTNN